MHLSKNWTEVGASHEVCMLLYSG